MEYSPQARRRPITAGMHSTSFDCVLLLLQSHCCTARGAASDCSHCVFYGKLIPSHRAQCPLLHEVTQMTPFLKLPARSAPSAASSSAHSRSRSTSRRWAVTMAPFGGNAQQLVLTSSARARYRSTYKMAGGRRDVVGTGRTRRFTHTTGSRGAGTTVISRPFLSFVGARSRSQGIRPLSCSSLHSPSLHVVPSLPLHDSLIISHGSFGNPAPRLVSTTVTTIAKRTPNEI